MKKKFKKFTQNTDRLAALALAVIVSFIALTNIKPGTWFIGWDAVMHEFNYGINLERHLTSTWQEYQGLGLLGGMGHAADLPRMLIQYPLSLVLPDNYVRYAYIFLALYLGSLGLYYLAKFALGKLEKNKKNSPRHSILAFCAALFFILNQGTLQTFYAPMLVFITQWAALPWLFFSFCQAVETGSKKYYLLFAISTFFGAQMAYVPTLFLVYILAISLAGLILLYSEAQKGKLKETAIELTTLATITIIINLFWVVPFAYFYLSGGSNTVIESSINQIITEEIFNRNRARGTATDVPLIRGYLYDTYDLNADTNEFKPMMQPWIEHYSMQWTEAIGYILFVIVIIGALYAIKKRNRYGIIFVSLFFLALFLLSASNPPLGFLFDWLRENNSIFREAFRFPYTKTAQLATMLYAVLFALGLSVIDKTINKLLKMPQTELLAVTIAFSLMVYALPVFSGNLLFPELKVRIPRSYFQMFDWFEDQPREPRIANIPQADLMNWYVHDWGYRGTGFIWYGLRQPVLDRSFDPWSSNNEEYYNEMTNALYRKDSSEVARIMEKYHIGWLVYDKSLRINWNDEQSNNSNYDEQILPAILRDQDFELVKTFGDNLQVIAYKPVVDQPNFVEYYQPDEELDGYINPNRVRPLKNINESDIKFSEEVITVRSEFLATKQDSLNIPNYLDSNEILLNDVSVKAQNGKILVQITPRLPEVMVNNRPALMNNKQTTNLSLERNNYLLTTELSALDINSAELTSEYKQIGSLFLQQNEKISLSVQSNKLNCSEATLESEEQEKKICPVRVTGKNEYLKLEFSYKTNKLFFPSVCIRDNSKNQCLEALGEIPMDVAIDNSELYSNVFMTPNTSDRFELSLPTAGSNLSAEVTNISYTTYRKTQDIVLNLMTNVQTIPLKDGENTILVSYPVIANSPLGYKTDLTEVSERGDYNCLGESINPVKQIYTVNEVNGAIEMYAKNAETCSLLWVNQKLPLKYNYLLNVQYKHNFGYPIEVRVNNKHYGFNFDRFMLNPNQIERNIFVSASANDGEGLEVNAHLLSRGRFGGASEIRGVSLQYFPRDFLNEIAVEGEYDYDYEKRGGENIVNSRKSTYLYTVEKAKPGYYSNNQSYNPGWIAVTDKMAIIETQEFDGWSNIWKVNRESSTLYIFYLPQLFQFAGMASMIMSLVTIVGYGIDINKKR